MPDSYRVPVKEFTTAVGAAEAEGAPLEPVEFSIDGDAYYAAPVAPAEAILGLAGFEEATGAKRAGIIADYLDHVLLEDSRERLAARMRDTRRPMTLDEVGAIVKWLAEEVYGGARPSVIPSSSASG